jgi:ComEC/Rec2-related protein
MSWSRLTNPLLLFFLLGVVAHSVFPYTHISPTWIVAGIVVSLGGYMLATNSYRFPCLFLLAFVLGLLRFSLAQPSLPRGLIFANPKGLAIAVDPPHTADHLDPRHWLSRGRTNLTAHAYEILPADEAALLTGLLYGARDLSKADKLAFRHAGLTHIIAVSGANITIIVVCMMRLLLVAHLTRRHAFYACVLTIASFTLFVGPSASVVRAALMGILVEMAPLVGRLVHPARLLLISACAFVLWHPIALAFDPSFALSFLAMLGLLTWGRWLDSHLAHRIPSAALREIATSTISATVMTAPYAAWACGNVTFWGLPTGFLVLPLIPWTMALGSLALVVPTSITTWFAIPVAGLLKSILWIARLPDRLGAGFFDRATLSFVTCCAIYVAIFMLWQRCDQKNIHKPSRS